MVRGRFSHRSPVVVLVLPDFRLEDLIAFCLYLLLFFSDSRLGVVRLGCELVRNVVLGALAGPQRLVLA